MSLFAPESFRSRAAAPATAKGDGALVPAVRPLYHRNQPVADGMGRALQFSIDHLAANVGEDIVLVPASYSARDFTLHLPPLRQTPAQNLRAPAQVTGLSVKHGIGQDALFLGLPSSGVSPITDSVIESDKGLSFTIFADSVSAARNFIDIGLTNVSRTSTASVRSTS